MTDVLDINEACAYLKLARSTIYRLSREGVIPHTRIGRSLRFKKEVLDDWLRKGSEARVIDLSKKHSN